MWESLLHAWIALGIVVFFSLFFVRAPYGRHTRKTEMEMDSRTGWLLMEAPAPLLMLVLFLGAGRWEDPVLLVFLLMWLGHYGHRTFVWPFRARLEGRTMPYSIVAGAFIFNVINAGLHGHLLFEVGPEYGADWLRIGLSWLARRSSRSACG